MIRVFRKAGWGAAGALGLIVIVALAAVVVAGPPEPSAEPGLSQEAHVRLLPDPINTFDSYILTNSFSGSSGPIGIISAGSTIDLRGFAPGGDGSAPVDASGLSQMALGNGIMSNWAGFGQMNCAAPGCAGAGG